MESGVAVLGSTQHPVRSVIVDVMFVTAEIEPLVATGGLGAAAAGLVHALRTAGVDCIPVVPDYGNWPLEDEHCLDLEVPSWVGHARVRTGTCAGLGAVALIDVAGISRPHPYVDPVTGVGWPDNDQRFFAFSRAAAAWAAEVRPKIVHVNDWHAATTLAHLSPDQRTVLSIHNLAHQGWSDRGWLEAFGERAERFEFQGSVNALAGALNCADRIVTVSPRYAEEIHEDHLGMGLAPLIRMRGADVVGILNGIDTEDWNPATDRYLAANYSTFDSAAKAQSQKVVCAELGLSEGPGPLVVCVTRLDFQKGIDQLIDVVHVLSGIPVRVALLGSGDHALEEAAGIVAVGSNATVAFRRGYDRTLAHQLFAAGDFALIPSRFEPCGLTQMQAMRYGTIPIVADVGGLHDTVIDADQFPKLGTGIVMREVSAAGIVDGVHRAARISKSPSRQRAIANRGMARDWSWDGPAQRYTEMYKEVLWPGSF